jgi:hypothetical protein
MSQKAFSPNPPPESAQMERETVRIALNELSDDIRKLANRIENRLCAQTHNLDLQLQALTSLCDRQLEVESRLAVIERRLDRIEKGLGERLDKMNQELFDPEAILKRFRWLNAELAATKPSPSAPPATEPRLYATARKAAPRSKKRAR